MLHLTPQSGTNLLGASGKLAEVEFTHIGPHVEGRLNKLPLLESFGWLAF